MKKFIITRLGLDFPNKKGIGVHAESDPDYILNIVQDMLNFTYHSVRNQTAKDITWVFYTGRRFKHEMKEVIEDTILDIPVEFISEMEYKNQRKPWDAQSPTMVFRLDADDYMHPALIEKIESNLLAKWNGDNIVISNPIKGYKLYPDQSLTEFEAPHIALGLGVLSGCGAIPMHDHTKLPERFKELFPTKEVIVNNLDTDERLYLYRRHENAHSFCYDKNYEEITKVHNSLDILEEFGVLNTRYWERNRK